jgi:hypothetical protein
MTRQPRRTCGLLTYAVLKLHRLLLTSLTSHAGKANCFCSARSSELVARGPIAIAGIAVFTFLVSYFRLFIFPNVPMVLGGDQNGFFYNGSRIVSGQLPYRGYFQIVPPGTDLIYSLLIKCFGLYAWIPNLVMAFLAAVWARRLFHADQWSRAVAE